MKNGSATTGTLICWYQLPQWSGSTFGGDDGQVWAALPASGAVKFATAAHWVTVRRPEPSAPKPDG